MKKFSFLITAGILLIALVPMQSQTYHLTVSNEPFEFLENGVAAVTETWDDPSFTAPLGFTFEFFDETTTSLYSPDFFVGGLLSTNLNFSAMDLVIPFSVDLIDRGWELDSFLSPIVYRTVGTPGNRIFTIEYNNVGFYSGQISNGISVDYVNFQLRIIEQSGDIEVHIGPYSVDDAESDFEGNAGPLIGLIQDFDFVNSAVNGEVFILDGDPLNPAINTKPVNSYVDWPIPEGTVYRFSRTPSAVSDPKPALVSDYYFPNPARDFVTLKPELVESIASSVYVINSIGQLARMDNDPAIIEIDYLSAGIYTLNFLTDAGQVSQRISLIK